MVAGAAIATAATVLVAVLWGLQSPRAQSPSSILEASAEFFAAETPEDGFSLAKTPAPENYPFSRDLLRLAQIRWRTVHQFLGGTAVAYDLPGPPGSRATLYVARQTVSGLPTLPPNAPTWDSGCSAAAWQDGDTLYVLVVDGDSRAYQGYLNLARGPLT